MPDAELIVLAERLQGLCLGRHLTVGTAESCTGGLVAASITAVAGASGYFVGGVVAYADSVKEGLIDVPATSLAAHGAVSAQVAQAMAVGARARLGVDLAVSVTGIAGPEGGTEAKPLGLTYLGRSTAAGAEVRRFVFSGDRSAIRHAAAAASLEWLIAAAEHRE